MADNIDELVNHLFSNHAHTVNQFIQLEFDEEFTEQTLFPFCCELLFGGLKKLYGDKHPTDLSEEELHDIANRLSHAGIKLVVKKRELNELDDSTILVKVPDANTAINTINTINTININQPQTTKFEDEAITLLDRRANCVWRISFEVGMVG